jgi:pimeloyl-ACP methyl ester carboxylesterase
MVSSALPRRRLVVALVVAALAASGCTTMRQVFGFKEQEVALRAMVRISGTIETEGPVDGTLVVLVETPIYTEDGSPVLDEKGRPRYLGVDTYTRATQGTFLFHLPPDRYRLGAYEDRNRNGILNTGERVSSFFAHDIIELEPGERARISVRLINDEVHEGAALDVLGLVERDVREQGRFALWNFSAMGELVGDLSDPRFGSEQGPFGLWRPMDFLNQALAGIYFLEEYDADRIPVLFVHGISGYPEAFSTLIEDLDESRFQPWFYFYPSGIGLSETSRHLATLLRKLQMKYDFDEVAIVAHSMGGLVSRGAILTYVEDTKRDDIGLFISLNSPFGGDARAVRTERARIAIPQSFRDMNPASEYMTWLFYEEEDRKVFKTLPDDTEHHMIIGYKGTGEPYNDGAVTVETQAHTELQEHATTVRIWNYTHVGILNERRTSDRVNRLLEARF